MYHIEREPLKRRIILIFDHYQDHDSSKFISELQESALSVRGPDRQFDMLADFSDSMVMPREIAKDSEGIAAWCIANGLRRSANVMQSITQRMQVQRVTEKDHRFGYFETRQAAEAWLDTAMDARVA